MYYEVHRSAPKVLTRQMAGRYLAENVRIPKYMDIIANGAFQKRNVIQSVQFPSTLSRIGANAFYGCYFLRSVQLPENCASLACRLSQTARI